MTQTHYFVGEAIDNSSGERIACAGARVPHGSDPRGLVVLDALTPLYGSNLPEPNERGWIIRPLAQDVTIPHAAKVLEHVGPVTETRPMALQEITEIAGQSALRGFSKIELS